MNFLARPVEWAPRDCDLCCGKLNEAHQSRDDNRSALLFGIYT
jgi:hypothetical protein